MTTYMIYFSPTKGTEKIARTIANTMGAYQEIDLSELQAAQTIAFTKEDVCIFAVPSYGGRVPAIALTRMRSYQGNGAKAIGVAVYGNRAYEDTLKELQDFLSTRGFCCVALIAAIAQHSIMRQFALGRPNQKDQTQLQDFTKQILQKLRSDTTYSEVQVSGGYPYREYKGVPLKPKSDKGCSGCGICAKCCPVGAIDIHDPRQTDTKTCISCMRCVNRCPSHARKVSKLKVKLAAKKMEKVCMEEKENELFL